MQYFEIVEKLRNHERVPTKEISGFQLLMLLQDKEIESIDYRGNVFEINFISITYAFDAYALKEEELPTIHDAEKIIEHWINCYDVKKAIYVQIENEYFEIILDLLETK
jgi:hypothetical protein